MLRWREEAELLADEARVLVVVARLQAGARRRQVFPPVGVAPDVLEPCWGVKQGRANVGDGGVGLRAGGGGAARGASCATAAPRPITRRLGCFAGARPMRTRRRRWRAPGP